MLGMLDFQNPIVQDDVIVYWPSAAGRPLTVPASGIEVAKRGDDSLDFHLELLRPAIPGLPPDPYGVLDMRLSATYSLDKAIAAARNVRLDAIVECAPFTGGFLRLVATGELPDAPKEIFEPVTLAWNGLTTGRVIRRLPMSAATFIEGALSGPVLPIEAIAEMEVAGISPRLSLKVRFDPARLVGALRMLADTAGCITRDDLTQFFRGDPATLPLEVTRTMDTLERASFAEAMADRVRSRFASFIPGRVVNQRVYMQLVSADQIQPGLFEWDLSQAEAAKRAFALRLDPLAAARAIVQNKGTAALVDHVTIPPIPKGSLTVSVSTNLPASRAGALATGVTLSAPPNAPNRPQAINKSVELVPPKDLASAVLQFSPIEPQKYTYTTFVVVQTDKGVERLDGTPTAYSGDTLLLVPDDFAIRVIAIEVSTELLQLADLNCTVAFPPGSPQADLKFQLTSDNPAAAITVARGQDDGTLSVEAVSHQNGKALRLEGLPISATRLELSSFREYGPHKITITCVFATGEQLTAIEILPEGKDEQMGNINVLHFTPAQPSREWTWFADSPFLSGYRYRVRRQSDAPSAPWSEVESAFSCLEVHSAAVAV
jgi:hypothetical protein